MTSASRRYAKSPARYYLTYRFDEDLRCRGRQQRMNFFASTKGSFGFAEAGIRHTVIVAQNT